MFRVVSMVFQGLRWAWRRRILPILLALMVALWGFDRLIFLVTEAQWFASLGFGGLFWSRLGAQALLFSGFSLVALALTGAFLPSVTRFSDSNAPALRGQLAGFEPLRRRVSRLAWSVLTLAALFLASRLARHWSDWLLLRGARAWGASGSSFGLPRELWTHFLPVFVPFLGALWVFSLVLWLVVAATGTVRALPLLAARAPSPPLVLPRALWRLGAFLLMLGALRNAVHLLDLSRGRALETGDLVVCAPIFALGALACGVLSIMAWRRSTARAALQKWSKLGFGIAASLILPGMLNWLSAPLRAFLPDTPWIARERQNATRAAWHLASAEMTQLNISPSIEAQWPVWDEKTLLQAQRGARFRGKRVVEWQSATLDYESKWRAYLAGVGAGATTWTSGRDADENTRLEFERLDFSGQNGAPTATPLKTEAAFFGFEGRSLFGRENGVSIASMGWKWAWAWRLRDALLPLDGASATRLLVWRGARERAEKIAPWLVAGGEPRLVFDGQNPVWLLDLNAADANFPGALSVPDGELAGQNEAGESVTMRLDARSGAVSFFAAPAAETASSTRGLPVSREISAALRPKIGVSPALLRAQVALEMAVRSGDLGFAAPVYGPLHSYETGRGAVSRALLVRDQEFLSLETAGAAPIERVFRRVEEDFGGKVASLDAQLGQEAPPPNEDLQLGEPFAWPDISAPGGFWLGRASFAAPRVDAPLQGMTGHGLQLWRVALTGILPGSRIEVASSAREARLRFSPDGGRALTAPRVVSPRAAPTVSPTVAPKSTPVTPKSTPIASQIPPNKSSLEAQALQFHRASQAAAKRGDWTAFARESAQLDGVLRRLSARKVAGN